MRRFEILGERIMRCQIGRENRDQERRPHDRHAEERAKRRKDTGNADRDQDRFGAIATLSSAQPRIKQRITMSASNVRAM